MKLAKQLNQISIVRAQRTTMYYVMIKNTIVKRENNTLGRHEENCSAAATTEMQLKKFVLRTIDYCVVTIEARLYTNLAITIIMQ